MGEKNVLYSAGVYVNFLTGVSNCIGYGQVNSSKYDSIKNVDSVSGCAFLFKSDVIKKIGLLDSEYFAYYEETDFCLRARKAGYKILYVPSAIAWHEGAATAKRSYQTKYFIPQQNQFRFIIKNFDAPHMILAFLFQTIVMTALFFAYYSTINRNSFILVARLKAIIWNLTNFRKSLKKRWEDYARASQAHSYF
jgi:hypothetical protein